MSQEMSPEQRLEWWNDHAADATDNELAVMWGRLNREERHYLWSNFTFRERTRIRIASLNEWGNIPNESVGLPVVSKWLLLIGIVIAVIIVLALFV